jgi:hypothetical protein
MTGQRPPMIKAENSNVPAPSSPMYQTAYTTTQPYQSPGFSKTLGHGGVTIKKQEDERPSIGDPALCSSRFQLWNRNNWTASQYADIAQICESLFPFEKYAAAHGKRVEEVWHVFRHIIAAPALRYAGSGTDLPKGGLGELRVIKNLEDEKKMHTNLRKLCEAEEKQKEVERKHMRIDVEAELRESIEEELRPVVESELRGTLERDIRTQIEMEYGITKKGARIKTVEEAMEDLQSASRDLEKAKKAADRRTKLAAKKNTGGPKKRCSDNMDEASPGRERKRGKLSPQSGPGEDSKEFISFRQ